MVRSWHVAFLTEIRWKLCPQIRLSPTRSIFGQETEYDLFIGRFEGEKVYPKIVYNFLYYMYYTGMSSPVYVPLLILLGIFRENEVAMYILTPLGVLCVIWLGVVVPLLASKAAWGRVVLGLDFWDADSFGRKMLMQALTFIPIIGPYFEKEENDGSGDPPPLE